jgi:hypothetical protein
MANNTWISAVSVVTAIGLTFVVLPHCAVAQQRAISVRIQDYTSGLTTDVIADTRGVVDHIYAEAGIEVRWKSADAPLVVFIVPRQMADRFHKPPNVLGFAVGTATVRGRVAYVLEHRVDELTRGYRLRKNAVLGAVIAHEIGHLLLPYRSHSAKGIMKAELTAADFRDALAGRLLFTSEQAELLKARIGS